MSDLAIIKGVPISGRNGSVEIISVPMAFEDWKVNQGAFPDYPFANFNRLFDSFNQAIFNNFILPPAYAREIRRIQAMWRRRDRKRWRRYQHQKRKQ